MARANPEASKISKAPREQCEQAQVAWDAEYIGPEDKGGHQIQLTDPQTQKKHTVIAGASHSKSGPIKCNRLILDTRIKCTAAYQKAQQLKDHDILFHERRPIVCPFCHAIFGDKSNARRHLNDCKESTVNVKFRCPAPGCGKTASRKDNIKRHMAGCSKCEELIGVPQPIEIRSEQLEGTQETTQEATSTSEGTKRRANNDDSPAPKRRRAEQIQQHEFPTQMGTASRAYFPAPQPTDMPRYNVLDRSYTGFDNMGAIGQYGIPQFPHNHNAQLDYLGAQAYPAPPSNTGMHINHMAANPSECIDPRLLCTTQVGTSSLATSLNDMPTRRSPFYRPP